MESLSTESQLELPISRHKIPDRNAGFGGRSFYFFDFDDNVMHLKTNIYIFHRVTGEEVALSTQEFARVNHMIGVQYPFLDYQLSHDESSGSFRRFRDSSDHSSEQPFVEDLQSSILDNAWQWKGPSWSLFDYAVYNHRPVAIITARGHHTQTILRGLHILTHRNLLPQSPNCLGIFTVSHPDVRALLGDPSSVLSIPELKKRAIDKAVEEAMLQYGLNKYHRFGMSDDDPKNVELILEAMAELKRRYPDNAFFVIDTSQRPVQKTEVFLEQQTSTSLTGVEQLELF